MSLTRPTILKRQRSGKPSIRLLLVALVVVGFALQGLLPGLDLAFRGDFSRTAFGVEAAMCHSSSSGPAASDEEGTSDGHGCCLVCQTAGLTKVVPPFPTFKIPTAGTAELLIVGSASTRVDGRASRQNPARAPPVFVA
ncbi:hypothetical protein CU669_10475 [Paramagnetospirillum kuznetsovii]|uniref:DUF2946 domain-containing protein n=1 Tax=Paramagnetospirillum kuznetsovii TaxID=2053833 RepID=A0A364NYW2_9PROT|nr:DUF2946 family protein [Paramagnetospirillum kuznetsovii]RAU22095.1 hypothetical protein CU669_10475 [Paramagnetospirillum kuznetsovii]